MGWRLEETVQGFFARLLAATALMSAAIIVLRLGLGQAAWGGGFVTLAAATGLTAVVAVLVYGAALWLMRVEEVRGLGRFLRRGR